MKTKLQRRGVTGPQALLTLVLCLLSLASIFYVIATDGNTFDIFYCLATVPFVCLPPLLGIVFGWHLNTVLYVVFSFYTMGPLLGAVYKLYYVTPWWDDLLHLLAGFLFAVCGVYLAYALNRKGTTSVALAALFGVFFSMGIAVFWEIFEFSSDVFLGSDMQADTLVDYVATKLGRTDGGVTVFENITDVVIGGKPLGLGGYLDIGLYDTMNDMLVETAGALVYMVYALIDRERHPMITSMKK